LANKKTVTIQPSGVKDAAVVLSTTKTKKQNAPAKLYHKSVMRKEFRKMAKAVKNQVLARETTSLHSFLSLLCLAMLEALNALL
jgi:large subunit ribosomal protein L28e